MVDKVRRSQQSRKNYLLEIFNLHGRQAEAWIWNVQYNSPYNSRRRPHA